MTTRRPSWVTALAHELGHQMRQHENATLHEHRVAYRLGVWRVRQWQREARTAAPDPTVDRYDWHVGVRKGRVECLWPVAAHG